MIHQHTEQPSTRYSAELLDVVFKIALLEMQGLPVDQADRNMADLRTGKAVVALYVADGITKIKLNPNPERIQSCFQ